MARNIPLPIPLKSKLVELRDSGKTQVEIADIYNVTQSLVSRWYKKRGVEFGRGNRPNAPRGVNHKNWKGTDVGYGSIHEWVRRYYPKPDLCEECNFRPAIDLANIKDKPNPKTYTRDFINWRYLCRRCHMLSDGRMKNLKRGRKPKEYAPCGRDIAARGVCLKQYNFERRGTKTDNQNWTNRDRAKPCEFCGG